MSNKGKGPTATGSALDTWVANTPENKLELIDGRLIICSLEGSRRIAWMLLDDHGPPLGLRHAPPGLWWQALQEAYQPSPTPTTPEEWWLWAESAEAPAIPPAAGPFATGKHRQVWQNLQAGLYTVLGTWALGHGLGRDFVVRLGEQGLTPDHIVLDRAAHANLTENYHKGPPTIAMEVTQPNTNHFDRQVKFRLHEQAGTPEYWLFDPFAQEAEFWRLEQGRYQRVTVEGDTYASAALPGLVLFIPDLWETLPGIGRGSSRPFLPATVSGPPWTKDSDHTPEELGWDSVPFAPRVSLEPQAIRFEEYISWCGRAKFERYGKGLVIGGSLATERVFGLLLMTFGLREIVRLAHPRDWVTFLAPHVHPELDTQVSQMLAQATFRSRQDIQSEIYWIGEVPEVDWVASYADSEDECRAELAQNVRDWVLLGLARGET